MNANPPLILVLNGPNLNRLGRRQPDVYGSATLDGIAAKLHQHAAELGVAVDVRQSNHEGHLIDWLHEAEDEGARAVILNPGGYGHTSVALHDAILSVETPVIVVHITDPAKREAFRHIDLAGDAAARVIKGEGPQGYVTALDAAALL